MNMNIKQTKTNKNKILKLFLIFVFIFGISFPVNAAPTQLHPEGNPEKQTAQGNPFIFFFPDRRFIVSIYISYTSTTVYYDYMVPRFFCCRYIETHINCCELFLHRFLHSKVYRRFIVVCRICSNSLVLHFCPLSQM